MKTLLINLSDLKIDCSTNRDGRVTGTTIRTESDKIATAKTCTSRFWRSFNKLHGLSQESYLCFSPTEVLDRYIQKKGDSQIKLTVGSDSDDNRAFGCVRGDQATITLDEAGHFLTERGGISEVKTKDGVARSSLEPALLGNVVKLFGEDYAPRVGVEIPIDGVGSPKFSVGFLRLVCLNGMMAWGSAFESPIRVGSNNPMPALGRAFSSFNNEKGFDQLSRRLVEVKESYASLLEVRRFIQLAPKNVREAVYGILAGRFCQSLSHSLMTDKARSKVATNIRLFDLLNMATEFSTHHCEKAVGEHRMLSAFVTDTLSKTPDCLGSARQDGYKSVDFHLTA